MPNTKNPPHRIPPYRRPIVVVGFLLTLAVVIIVTIFVCLNLNQNSETTSPNDSSQSPPPTSNTPTTPKPDESDDTQNTGVPDDKVSQFEGENPNNLATITGSITYKNVDRQTQTLSIAASINQYLQDGGECALKLTKDGAEIRSVTMPITPDITTSVCGPFEIPISDLSSGSYQIEIHISGDGKQGSITEGVWL